MSTWLFLAIDKAEIYYTQEYEILFECGIDYEKKISFTRFFSWCSPILSARVVIAGTTLRLRDMDRLSSGRSPLTEYGINIMNQFDYFGRSQVKYIVLELSNSYVNEDAMKRMSFLLQGRPRFLMNFIEKCKRKGFDPEEFFEQYIKCIVESGEEGNMWSLYGLWKYLKAQNEI
jgi:hypothetical protein